jgi:hypothetical protein
VKGKDDFLAPGARHFEAKISKEGRGVRSGGEEVENPAPPIGSELDSFASPRLDPKKFGNLGKRDSPLTWDTTLASEIQREFS